MDIEAKLMVGTYGGDLGVESVNDNESLYEFAEKHNLTVCSPYYDCCEYEEQFIGYEIRTHVSEDDLVDEIKATKERLYDIGVYGGLEAVPDVC